MPSQRPRISSKLFGGLSKHQKKISTNIRTNSSLFCSLYSRNQTAPVIVHFQELLGSRRMENPTVQIRPVAHRVDSFIIHLRDRDRSHEAIGNVDYKGSGSAFSSCGGANISPTKILSRIRKIFMRFIFYFPSRGSSAVTSRQRSSEEFEPPKTSCSSHYSSYSHYSEAIADCIEFFNKSSQEQLVDGGNSDASV